MCPAAIILITALSKSLRLFHRNLRQVAQFHLIIYAVQNMIRVYMLLYDTGLLKTTDHVPRHYKLNMYDFLVITSTST
ncbi:unnamed protein product [Cylicocyclus nassatus]|uniref:Uncharacterized protein n=1 Tax=Cylicocyclus nassatus TaxID=53992 RepID=A0AA36H3H2_CYLNA|nr:unnamed protein product [Cylicocyclus nassatus]